MAKKSAGQRLNSFSYWDNWVLTLYDSGVLQSSIFHTVLLLILALISLKENDTKPIVLTLSFDAQTDQQVSNEEFPSIEILENQAEESLIGQDASPKVVDTVVHEESESVEVKFPELDIVDNSSETAFVASLDPQILNKLVPDQTPQDIKQPAAKPTQGSYTASRGLGDGDQSAGDNGHIREIQKRLKKSNAGSGDLQISIAWNTTDDIDLHVNYRSSKINSYSYICWIHRNGIDGVFLDVDKNAFPTDLTDKPVENIFWPKNSQPKGEVVIGLHFFKSWSGNSRVPVTVLINNKGEITSRQYTAVYGLEPTEVLRFKVN